MSRTSPQISLGPKRSSVTSDSRSTLSHGGRCGRRPRPPRTRHTCYRSTSTPHETSLPEESWSHAGDYWLGSLIRDKGGPKELGRGRGGGRERRNLNTSKGTCECGGSRKDWIPRQYPRNKKNKNTSVLFLYFLSLTPRHNHPLRRHVTNSEVLWRVDVLS